MLAESLEPQEQEGFKETSPSGDAVEEAEGTEHVLSQKESEAESDAEAEPAEPEWLQRRIDRFTRNKT